MAGHLNEIRALSFSPDGHWLASGSLDRTARLWNLYQEDPTINSLVLRGHEGGIMTLAFSPDNHWLATGSTDFTARAWDLTKPDPPTGLWSSTGMKPPSAPSPSAPTVTGWPPPAWITPPASGILPQQSVAALPIRLPGTASTILALDYSPDGRWLATGSAGWLRPSLGFVRRRADLQHPDQPGESHQSRGIQPGRALAGCWRS